MNNGFTTGSCAAAASKAACWMLLSGKRKSHVEIETPKGDVFKAELCDISIGETEVSCGVIKDGGDDPDCTTGLHIISTVALFEDGGKSSVVIDGGEGVGRVTLPGLDQQVGKAAINHVPREMIEKEIHEICGLLDYRDGVKVVISVPGGRETAQKTFNPRLGIVDGISILGTSGIVEPMSSQALIDTIKVELNQKKSMGNESVCVTPGNYGLDFMKNNFNYSLDSAVKCSNFIGITIDSACEKGFKNLLLCGHIGKLVKVAGGIYNTHSKEADCRMELLACAAIEAGCGVPAVKKIIDAATTEEGISIIGSEGKTKEAMSYLLKKIMFFLKKRAGGRINIGCMVYSNKFGLLAESKNAREILREAM